MTIDAALLEADRRARRDALDVSRSFIVQAPAGSGKTELLIQRYLRLLATVDEPEEVVAITFTRKAALEMQMRVMTALDSARRGVDAEAGHERRTLRAAADVLERDRAREWQLPDAPRRMRIQTLDAFCASVARLLPVSSRLGGAMTTLADAGMTRLYREAAVATLDWLTTDEELAGVVERVLEHLDNNTTDYIDYLARMLATRDQWLEIVGAGPARDLARARASLEAAIAAQVTAQLERIREAIEPLVDRRLPALARHAGEQLERRDGVPHPLASLPTAGLPAATVDALPHWRALADLLLTKDGTQRRRITRNEGFPTGEEKSELERLLAAFDEAPAFAANLARVRVLPDAAYADAQWQVLVALFDLLPVAAAELGRLFAERGVTDHIEVALAARRALGSPDAPGDAALKLDYRIRHLLVDEMQDTSVGQYQLLETLTAGWERGDGRTLFCVGDPMQSIYRFRDAEVGQFLAARRNGVGSLPLESLVLHRNFRSGEYLVHWFNSVFRRVLPARDDIAAGAISYSEAVPVEGRLGQGAVTVHPLIDANAAAEARHTATVIEECLAEDPAGEVAVLVRSRTRLPELFKELRSRSVPFRAVDIDRLTDLPEIIDVLALTRALCHLDDRIAWLALLRGPWAGLSWRDVHALVRNDTSTAVTTLAADEERLAELTDDGRARMADLFSVLSDHLGPNGARSLRERVESAWLALGGAASLDDADQLANVYRCFDVLEMLESAGTLPDVAMLERHLDEERVSSSSGATCRVQVMTMHKAKGLQFDHVVLHGLGRTAGRHDKAVLNWMSVAMQDGGSSMILSPLGPRASLEKDPLHRYIDEASKDADRLELDRLLYVACTRARRSLHLVASAGTLRGGEALRTPQESTLLCSLWPAVAADFDARFEGAGEPAARYDDDARLLVTPRLRRRAGPRVTPAIPALPPVPAPGLAVERPPVQYHWVGSTARHAGTVVHAWLRRLAGNGPALTALPPDAEAISRRWGRSLGVAPGDLDGLWRRVARSLGNVLADADGRWLLFGDGHSELRLTGMRDGRRESVVIDRVRIERGCHWIVDYKTSSHEGGDLERFLSQEQDRHRPQLQRYARIYRGVSDAPLRLALYFPLLRRLVEIEAGQAGSPR